MKFAHITHIPHLIYIYTSIIIIIICTATAWYSETSHNGHPLLNVIALPRADMSAIRRFHCIIYLIPDRLYNRNSGVSSGFRSVPGTGVRVRDRAGVAVRRPMEDPVADGRRDGGGLRPAGRVPDAHPDDGLVQAGRRGAPAHTVRVRLERSRSAVLQPRDQLADDEGKLQVLLHDVGRVHRAEHENRTHKLQRHRQQ